MLGLRPYSPGRPIADVQRELGLTDVIKLASNENPLGPSPKAMEAMRDALPNVHLYPDAMSSEARAALAVHHGLPEDCILAGNGSEELIALIGEIFIQSESDEVIAGDPSFARYETAAAIAPCRFIPVPLDDDLCIDLDAVYRAITPRTRLIFLANPNNPTGTIYRKTAFDAFMASLPSHVMLVLDEAYCEFAKHEADYPDGLSYIPMSSCFEHLASRTASREFGQATWSPSLR